MKHLIILLELTKVRISLFATLSASAGFILARDGITREIIPLLFGIYFLASGSCSLNQYQEREIDGLMERTKGRPLPSGRLNPSIALAVSIGLITSGSLALYYGTNWTSLGLGLSAILWYNGLYTYLKRKTAFAVIPGSVIGMIPPLLGWSAGERSMIDPRIWGVAFFFFIWQIPHFWLVLFDFSKDYEKAGLPAITKWFTAEQLRGIIFIWVLSAAASCLSLPLFNDVNLHFFRLVLLGATLWLAWSGIYFFRYRSEEVSRKSPLFLKLNLFVLFVVSSLLLDKLLYSNFLKMNLLGDILANIRYKIFS
jgi:protoheme IX farnesyltransferase